jgi:hypothetical protein
LPLVATRHRVLPSFSTTSGKIGSPDWREEPAAGGRAPALLAPAPLRTRDPSGCTARGGMLLNIGVPGPDHRQQPAGQQPAGQQPAGQQPAGRRGQQGDVASRAAASRATWPAGRRGQQGDVASRATWPAGRRGQQGGSQQGDVAAGMGAGKQREAAGRSTTPTRSRWPSTARPAVHGRRYTARPAVNGHTTAATVSSLGIGEPILPLAVEAETSTRRRRWRAARAASPLLSAPLRLCG